MNEQKILISEAARLVDVESHVLRYWEDELHIPVSRTQMGHRYYTKEDIQLFCCIKKLKDEGVTIKELKKLVPDLLSTKEKCEKPEPYRPSAVPVPLEPDKPETEIITDVQLKQVRDLIGNVLNEVVTSNNEVLEKEISKTVTSNVMHEMKFLMQAKDRRDEEHFRKLDILIRQQQALRREASNPGPINKIKRILT